MSKPRLDPDELAALEDQRDFLLRSLDDLEREHDAGDLDDADYEALRSDYTGRAAETLRAIEDQRSLFDDAKRDTSWGRRIAVFGGVAVFAVLAGFLVASALGARKSGDAASGGINVRQSPSQRAQACQQEMDPVSPSAAVECFQGVLEDDPRNVVANTFLAWQLELSSDYVPEAQSKKLKESAEELIERAVADDPAYSYARAFRAVLAYRHGRYEDAERFLADFRQNKPSTDAKAIIDQFELDRLVAEALAGDLPEEPGEGGANPFTTTTTTP